jgi:hypothetical protein
VIPTDENTTSIPSQGKGVRLCDFADEDLVEFVANRIESLGRPGQGANQVLAFCEFPRDECAEVSGRPGNEYSCVLRIYGAFSLSL